MRLYSVLNLFLTSVYHSTFLFWDVNFSFMHQILHSDWASCSLKEHLLNKCEALGSVPTQQRKTNHKTMWFSSPVQLLYVFIHYLFCFSIFYWEQYTFFFFHFTFIICLFPCVSCFVSGSLTMVLGACNSNSFQVPLINLP